MLEELAPWLAQGGIVGVLAWLGYRLHKDAIDAKQEAIAAESRRADDARSRAEAAEKRADLREKQIDILLSKVQEPTP